MRILARLLLLGWVFCLPVTAHATGGVPQIPENQDVRIIVDISGSMRTTDPENLRQPAVRLLARLLPENTTAGVWTFGQYVNMLVPHGRVDDGWRDQAIDSSALINSVALRTNLGRALEVASDDHYSHGDLTNTHFILLTDGKVDVSDDAARNEGEKARVLGSVLSGLADAGATIHTIALSEAADLSLLETLADRTGGSFALASTADDLNLAFLRSFNSAVPQEQIPIEGNQFLVDSGVQEFTALIFPGTSLSSEDADPLWLVNPAGQRETAVDHSSNTRWASERGYDLITVSEPEAGQWQIGGALGEGSRVTVVSDLKMIVAPLPLRFDEQEPIDIEAVFYEQDSPITDADFLNVIDVSLTITSSDGRSGTKHLATDGAPTDGVYRDEISRLPFAGDYQLDLVANGKTFSRKYSQTVTFVVPQEQANDGSVLPEASLAQLTDSVEPGEEPGEQEEPEAVEPDGQQETPPQPEPEVDPEPEAVAVEAEDIAPIDITAVETPESPPVAEEHEENRSDWVVWATGGAGVLGLIGVLAGALMWRRKRSAPIESPASATPLADELDADVSVEETEESEPEPEQEQEQEQEPEPLRQEETVEGSEEQDIPQLEEEVMDSEDDEFGLEDFDLSDIDEIEDASLESDPVEADDMKDVARKEKD